MLMNIRKPKTLTEACELVASYSLSTGHADTWGELVSELLWQIDELRNKAEFYRDKANEHHTEIYGYENY